MKALKLTRIALIALVTIVQQACSESAQQSAEGTTAVSPSRVEEVEAFSSQHIGPRNLSIYLPPGYDSSRTYAVCYMHDGQNLFHPDLAYGEMEWGVDEALDTLGYDLIVVGIWNTARRYQEYMPQKPEEPVYKALTVAWETDSHRFDPAYPELMSDAYLLFITSELMPWVEEHYAVSPDRERTFIAGSSMGGLISCYALGEYPGVFGGAACLSTHLPALNGVFLEYLAGAKPSPTQGAHLWMDHGTLTLDSTYAPFQQKADALLIKGGWTPGADFVSRVYEGTEHNELSWRRRLPEVFGFLMERKVPE